LILASDFAGTGYERCRYYPETVIINGDSYYVCSQWVPERIERLKKWYEGEILVSKNDKHL
jgi:hypothetical protein